MSKSEKNTKLRSSHPEIKGILLLGLSFFFILSLFTFHMGQKEGNTLGLAGYYLALGCTYLLGLLSYPLSALLGWLGWRMLTSREFSPRKIKWAYLILFTVSVGVLLNVCAEHFPSFAKVFASKTYCGHISLDLPYPNHYRRINLGGAPLYALYRDLSIYNLKHMLNDSGVILLCLLFATLSFLLLTNLRILPFLSYVKGKYPTLGSLCKKWLDTLTRSAKLATVEQNLESSSSLEKLIPSTEYVEPLYEPFRPSLQEKKIKPSVKRPPFQKISLLELSKGISNYKLPPPSLLNNPKKVDQPSLKKDLKRAAEILEETLLSFGIEAKVGEIHCGPTITSFEVHPAIGVKVQKITALENDLALKLQAKSIRIIAPIPGKAAVGVEIPSLHPQEVSFKEILLHYHQNIRKCHIPILLGKTVSGEYVVSDLAKMPHCLIAGATGSGKSVCINTIVMSILMNASPDEVKLLLVDPKKVELTAYTHLPHLIAPVITEAQGAYCALHWLVKEMQTRYEILKQLGLRNISSFNSRKVNRELEDSLSLTIPEKMAFIVAIIDEFADLMMVSSSDLETPIARIAQMARAVGIHLILATQRPSREVITGLIKANFPTRLAFKVSSRINSQIILDETGAESLLGNGDMLFLPPGTSHILRAQGAYISDEEIQRIISFICSEGPPNYLVSSFDNMPREALGDEANGDPKDSLYEEAYSIVVDTQTASTTFLQRKLKIGYARAASLIDELETKGVIGPQEGSKPRRILRLPSHAGKEKKNEAEQDE